MNFKTQIRLTLVCKVLHHYLRITDFYNIYSCYLNKLTDEILINYPHIIELNANKNEKITNVKSFLRTSSSRMTGVPEGNANHMNIKNIIC